MDVSRREFVLLGLGLLVAGCETQQQSNLLSPDWPSEGPRPQPLGPGVDVWSPQPPSGPPVAQTPAVQPGPLPVNPQPETPPDAGPIKVIPRSRWATGKILTDRTNPMNGVSRITVHHEGWETVYFTSAADTAARLDLIRRSHIERLHAGDIGYHYIIDRAGRVWQGRDVRYQGAHVRAENEHNIGVMVLGNFDVQTPSKQQMAALQTTLRQLMAHYRVPLKRVYTHQELNSTGCPGRNLQPRVVALRRGGYLV